MKVTIYVPEDRMDIYRQVRDHHPGSVSSLFVEAMERVVNGTPCGNCHPPVEAALRLKFEWMRNLLSKLPNFDPAWPDEVKAGWFDSFETLTARIEQLGLKVGEAIDAD